MRKYWTYLMYVLRHKWFVFVEARALGLGFWQSAIHDMSKLMPLEFMAYARFFGSARTVAVKEQFDRAWLHHIHHNPHHWQFWILHNDTDGVKVLQMPERFVKEMVADWRGVGRALGKGRENAVSWYLNNRESLALHPQTRSRVEVLLNVKIPLDYRATVPFPTPREPATA